MVAVSRRYLTETPGLLQIVSAQCWDLQAGRSNDEDIIHRKPPSPASHQRQELPFSATDGHDLTNGATHAGIAFERLAPNRRLDGAYIR